jgi:group I intron endonuclease
MIITSSRITYGVEEAQWFPITKGIYCIEHLPSGKKYVGRTNRVKKKNKAEGMKQRWKEHIYSLQNNRHWCNALQNAWNKYGPEQFCFYVLEAADKNLVEREAYYIQTLQTMTTQHGYNQILDLSEQREIVPETRARMSEAQRNRPPITEATREKIRANSTGRLHKPEAKAKLRAAHLGRPKKPQAILRNAMARVDEPFNLINTETGETFYGYNLTAFARAHGLSQGNLSEVFHGKRKSHKGWVRNT